MILHVDKKKLSKIIKNGGYSSLKNHCLQSADGQSLSHVTSYILSYHARHKPWKHSNSAVALVVQVFPVAAGDQREQSTIHLVESHRKLQAVQQLQHAHNV
jgi:hypothetical protein